MGRYRGAQALRDPKGLRGILDSAQPTPFPSPSHAVLLLSLRTQLQAAPNSKPNIASTLSPEAGSETARCVAVAWLPRTEGMFAAGFSSGNIYLYKKVGCLGACCVPMDASPASIHAGGQVGWEGASYSWPADHFGGWGPGLRGISISLEHAIDA